MAVTWSCCSQFEPLFSNLVSPTNNNNNDNNNNNNNNNNNKYLWRHSPDRYHTIKNCLHLNQDE